MTFRQSDRQTSRKLEREREIGGGREAERDRDRDKETLAWLLLPKNIDNTKKQIIFIYLIGKTFIEIRFNLSELLPVVTFAPHPMSST